MLSSKAFYIFAFGLLLLFACLPVQAATVEYSLTISKQPVNITGESREAMTVNGGIPGPVLRFREGDLARIHVHNKMDVDTSVHWHGLLVPNDMDGVPYVTYPPIGPGATFTYEFPIRQAGTYWYHSHTRLQEQRGVYGSIVIEPRKKVHKADKDYVVVLSEWTDEVPHEVLRTLKRGSEWYSIQKGSGQSIFGAARLGMLSDYFQRELQRMPPMDISDIAYDRFLANGRPESSLDAKPGEIVRLRIINGSAMTYFYLDFAGGPMTIIAADGQDVEPFETERFLIGVAETYDVLLKMPDAGACEFRATAHDGSSRASVWIGVGKRHAAPDAPKPNLYHAMGHLNLKRIFALTPGGSMGMSDRDVEAGKFDEPGGMAGMKSMDMGGPGGMKGTGMNSGMSGMPGMGKAPMDASHQAMDKAAIQGDHSMGGMAKGEDTMATGQPDDPSGKKFGSDFHLLASDVSANPNLAVDGIDPRRPWPPYARLRATRRTAFSRDEPVRDIRLTLDGDMERYVWLLNNKPLSESDVIKIHEGEVVRFIMINRTMMHHPMHLHGHFFRVINGQGDYSPLKHTVDVAPMSTTVIEFKADEKGDWFFHCHLLYHMKSGMARVVHYDDFVPAPQLADVRPNLYKEDWYFYGTADVLSNMTEGTLALADTRNILSMDWEVGWQNVEDTQWETIATWDRYLNRFFTIFAGGDLEGTPDEVETTRGVLGIRYLLPLNFESRMWADTNGGARFNLEKTFELTPRIGLMGEAQYDTHESWEGSVGLHYTISKSFSLMGQWHSNYTWGGGLQIRF